MVKLPWQPMPAKQLGSNAHTSYGIENKCASVHVAGHMALANQAPERRHLKYCDCESELHVTMKNFSQARGNTKKGKCPSSLLLRTRITLCRAFGPYRICVR